MRVLVTGATGFIGRHAVFALRRAGHEVICLARDMKAARCLFGDAPIRRCDFRQCTRAGDWMPLLEGVRAVVNTVGIIEPQGGADFETLHVTAPGALFDACRKKGGIRVVHISALGAEDCDTAFLRTRREGERRLLDSGLDGAILRPSIVRGGGGGSWALFNALAGLPVLPLPEGGRQPLRPIHVQDLAAAIVREVSRDDPGIAVISATGAEEVSLRGLLRLLRRWQGHCTPARILSVSASGMAFLAGVLRFFGVRIVSADTVRMLMRGSSASPEDFAARYGFMPEGVRSALSGTAAPSAAREQARLYFLHHLLRLSLAVMWLWSAITSALLWPYADSLAMLASLHIEGPVAWGLLFSAAALDFLFGLLMLRGKALRLLLPAQAAVILVYSFLVLVWLPRFWLHPFGPLLKNIPVLAAIALLWTREKAQ